MSFKEKPCLFITQSYPSINSPNSLCVEKIIENRPNCIRPVVLCYRFPGQKKYEEINGVKVYRIKKDWFWFVEGSARDLRKCNPLNRLLAKIITRLRQVIYLPLYPVYDLLAAMGIKRAACKIVNSENIDSVFADFNGCDTLIGGYRCCKITQASFYPIFWDYLVDGYPSKYVPKSFNDKRKAKLEKNILYFSKKTIMLDTAERKVRDRYSKNQVISNKLVFIGVPFFDTNNSNWISKGNKTFSFLYGGTNKDRQFEPFIETLSKLDLPVCFDIYTDSFADKYLLSLKNKYHFLNLHAPISSSALVKRCCETDFLVNFGVGNPNAVSSKIFLYFSTCKPVITTFRIKDESCLKFVEAYSLGFSFDENKPDIPSLKNFVISSKGKKACFAEVSLALNKNSPLFFWNSLDLK